MNLFPSQKLAALRAELELCVIQRDDARRNRVATAETLARTQRELNAMRQVAAAATHVTVSLASQLEQVEHVASQTIADLERHDPELAAARRDRLDHLLTRGAM